MAKIRLTTQELKLQREALKRFERFLPTLSLKKLQLQMEVNHVREALESRKGKEEGLLRDLYRWIGVLGEDAGIVEMVRIEEVEIGKGSIAGVEIPVYGGVRFQEIAYDLYSTPLWVDRAVERIRHLLELHAEILILRRQIERLEAELRTTVQRVNLFEKVKIPETHENIRRIQIFLGDQQTAAVVRGKMSKRKIQERTE